ncbi:MAG: BrnT family toxin [Gammaproteobacteria bacterium]
MGFEYDHEKSEANEAKQGIDFEVAQALWDDPDLAEIPAKVTDEPRSVVIGMMGDKHWSAVITYRSENIRLISVRRSRQEKVAIYESIGL